MPFIPIPRPANGTVKKPAMELPAIAEPKPMTSPELLKNSCVPNVTFCESVSA
jgi:hypothetical protein